MQPSMIFIPRLRAVWIICSQRGHVLRHHRTLVRDDGQGHRLLDAFQGPVVARGDGLLDELDVMLGQFLDALGPSEDVPVAGQLAISRLWKSWWGEAMT